jgi:hypothetical protein
LFSDQEFKEHFKRSHPDEYEAIKEHHEEEDGGDFTTSALIGYATNSALLGGLLGGDFVGGLVGDILNGDDD